MLAVVPQTHLFISPQTPSTSSSYQPVSLRLLSVASLDLEPDFVLSLRFPDWLDPPSPPDAEPVPEMPEDEMPSEDTLNYWAHRLLVSFSSKSSRRDVFSRLTPRVLASLFPERNQHSLSTTLHLTSKRKIDLGREWRVFRGTGRPYLLLRIELGRRKVRRSLSSSSSFASTGQRLNFRSICVGMSRQQVRGELDGFPVDDGTLEGRGD